MIKDGDPSALEPDVRVAMTLKDVLAGRDPVLEAALNKQFTNKPLQTIR